MFLVVFVALPELINAQSYYNKYEYRRKRHEITFGGGASSCLTDLGGRDAIGSGFLWDIDIAASSYVANFSYIYNLASKITLRANVAYTNISGSDELAGDFYRNNRRLNFTTTVLEGAAICEIIIRNARTGNRYNLKSPAGKFIGAKNPLGIGIYLFAGVGGFYYEPTGKDLFIGPNGEPIGMGLPYKLRPLHTEGQGMESNISNSEGKGQADFHYNFAPGMTYSPIAICVPMGFGFKKAFNGNAGIKFEAGFRFTNTDYLDDVSTQYYLHDDPNSASALMSGTNSGHNRLYIGYAFNPITNTNLAYPEGAIERPDLGGTRPYQLTGYYTEPGMTRGNPDNDDSYMFVTLSAYKKLNNAAKSYRTINMHQKRKIKASF
jgi:hypothetical protein